MICKNEKYKLNLAFTVRPTIKEHIDLSNAIMNLIRTPHPENLSKPHSQHETFQKALIFTIVKIKD